MYFHTWELDPEQPRIDGASLAAGPAVPEPRSDGGDRALLSGSLPLHQHRGLLALTEGSTSSAAAPAALADTRGDIGGSRPPRGDPVTAAVTVTVVVPCYNEEQSLPYLANTLDSVGAELGAGYALRFVFVDDGSTDGTWPALQTAVRRPGRLHARAARAEPGLAAAIQTGIRAAATEIVCSIDCDCTYDPQELRHMIPLLTDGVDLVTASPYHPAAAVRERPAAGGCSCREARRGCTAWCCGRSSTPTPAASGSIGAQRGPRPRSREPGFLGIAELLGRLDLRGRGDRGVSRHARSPAARALEDEGRYGPSWATWACWLSLMRFGVRGRGTVVAAVRARARRCVESASSAAACWG